MGCHHSVPSVVDNTHDADKEYRGGTFVAKNKQADETAVTILLNADGNGSVDDGALKEQAPHCAGNDFMRSSEEEKGPQEKSYNNFLSNEKHKLVHGRSNSNEYSGNDDGVGPLPKEKPTGTSVSSTAILSTEVTEQQQLDDGETLESLLTEEEVTLRSDTLSQNTTETQQMNEELEAATEKKEKSVVKLPTEKPTGAIASSKAILSTGSNEQQQLDDEETLKYLLTEEEVTLRSETPTQNTTETQQTNEEPEGAPEKEEKSVVKITTEKTSDKKRMNGECTDAGGECTDDVNTMNSDEKGTLTVGDNLMKERSERMTDNVDLEGDTGTGVQAEPEAKERKLYNDVSPPKGPAVVDVKAHRRDSCIKSRKKELEELREMRLAQTLRKDLSWAVRMSSEQNEAKRKGTYSGRIKTPRAEF